MPSKALKTRTTNSSSGSSSGRAAGISPRVSPRVATRVATRAASPGAATGRAASPSALATSPRSAAASVATAFAAYVAGKDTNRFHNLPEGVQMYIMKLARIKKKNSRGKYELYKKIYYNREVFMKWLDEIKQNGVDSKNRVRNPLREGGMIYTDKKGLYVKLWNLCVHIFQGDYNFNNGKIPYPIKIDYKPQSKFWNKPSPPQPPRPQSPI
jgi:hypothetical protein